MHLVLLTVALRVEELRRSFLAERKLGDVSNKFRRPALREYIPPGPDLIVTEGNTSLSMVQ